MHTLKKSVLLSTDTSPIRIPSGRHFVEAQWRKQGSGDGGGSAVDVSWPLVFSVAVHVATLPALALA